MTMTMLLLFLLFLKTTTRFGAKRARTGGIFSASYSRFFSGFSEADASPLLLLNERTMRKRAENPRLLSRPSLSLFLLRKRDIVVFGGAKRRAGLKRCSSQTCCCVRCLWGMCLFPKRLNKSTALVGWRNVTRSRKSPATTGNALARIRRRKVNRNVADVVSFCAALKV